MQHLLRRLRAAEQLLVLCGSTFLVMVGQGVVSPVLPLYARDFGVSTAMVGLTLTVFALARLLLNFPAGLIADRFGRRILLIGGPILTSVGMIGSGLADDIWTLLLWRFVAGAGSAFYMSGALIYLIDIARPDQRARFVAINQYALSLGVTIGPGIGGLLAERYGLSMPFHFVGVTAIGTAIYASIRLPETRKLAQEAARAEQDNGSDISIRTFAVSRRFIAIAFVAMTIFMVRAGRGTLLPLHAENTIGWGPGKIGLLFTATGIMTLFTLMPAAWAADHMGRRVVIIFSGVAAGLGAMVIAASSGVGIFIAGNILLTLGSGTAGPAPAAYIADIAPARIRGACIALYRSAGDVGFMIAPVALGALSDITSIPVALRVVGLLVALAGIGFAVSTRHDPASGRQINRSDSTRRRHPRGQS